MIWLLILFAWTFVALPAGCVIGLVIANAEKPLPELDAPEPDDIDWQHWDVWA
jgi:hypothetical protein